MHWKGGAIVTVHAQFAERLRALRADGRATVEWMLEALDVSIGTQSFNLRDQIPTQRRRDPRRGRKGALRGAGGLADRAAGRTSPGRASRPSPSPDGARKGERRDARAPANATSALLIDVVPRRLLALLTLPAGTLQTGRAVQVSSGGAPSRAGASRAWTEPLRPSTLRTPRQRRRRRDTPRPTRRDARRPI